MEASKNPQGPSSRGTDSQEMGSDIKRETGPSSIWLKGYQTSCRVLKGRIHHQQL